MYKKEWHSKQYLTAFTSNDEGTGSFYCVVLGSLNSEEIKFLSWEVCLLFSPRENTRALWSGSSGSPAVSLACTSEQFLFNLSIISLRYFPTELPAFQLKNANKGLWLLHWKITILNSSFAVSHCIHFISFPKLQFPYPRYLCCKH